MVPDPFSFMLPRSERREVPLVAFVFGVRGVTEHDEDEDDRRGLLLLDCGAVDEVAVFTALGAREGIEGENLALEGVAGLLREGVEGGEGLTMPELLFNARRGRGLIGRAFLFEELVAGLSFIEYD